MGCDYSPEFLFQWRFKLTSIEFSLDDQLRNLSWMWLLFHVPILILLLTWISVSKEGNHPGPFKWFKRSLSIYMLYKYLHPYVILRVVWPTNNNGRTSSIDSGLGPFWREFKLVSLILFAHLWLRSRLSYASLSKITDKIPQNLPVILFRG